MNVSERPVVLELDPARLATIAKALSDPSRLQLLKLVAKNPAECCTANAPQGEGVCICDLTAQTGLLQSLVSYHMRILREAGLVLEHRRGKWKHYRINGDTARAYLTGLSALLLQA